MSQLQVDSFSFQDPNGLQMAAKRYRSTSPLVGKTVGRTRTLIFAHCVGAHKEHWEPIIQRLFTLQEQQHASGHPSTTSIPIGEAWAFDRQNHGDSAALNVDALRAREGLVSVPDFASAITDFVKARLESKKNEDIIAIGHSAGAIALLLTTSEFPTTSLPYTHLFLVEPSLAYEHLYRPTIESAVKIFRKFAGARRDTWNSREEAREWLGKKFPWRSWDPRILDIYVEHGLKLVPSSTTSPTTSVTLKCDRAHEAVSYRPEEETLHFVALGRLKEISKLVSTHVILGADSGFLPFYVESLEDDAKSLTAIPKGGHLIVQEAPDAVADAIYAGLYGSCPVPHSSQSKL